MYIQIVDSRPAVPQQALAVVADARRAAVLLEPLRQAIVRSLLSAPASAAGLAARLGKPRQRLNYHLRELEAAGLVELVEERRKGNCTERVMRASARGYLLDPGAAAVGELDAGEVQDRFSATALIASAARAVRDVAALREGAAAKQKRLATASVAAEVRLRSPAAFSAFAAELAEAVAGVAARHHDAGAAGGRSFRVIAAAYPARAAEGGTSRATKEGAK